MFVSGADVCSLCASVSRKKRYSRSNGQKKRDNMSKERNGNAKEVLIRVMCFLLGVLLTVGAVLVKERVLPNVLPDLSEPVKEEEVVEESSEEESEEEKAEEEVKDDKVALAELIEKEAETKFEEIKAAKEEAVAEAPEPEDDGMYMIDGKPSKLNWNMDYPALAEENDLEWHAARKTSYEETMTENAFDKKIIEDCNIDFSDVKITILGDSITAGNNLSEEDQEMYNYPKQLADILGCEVVNLGIGGSVVSRNASNYPMVERWQEMSNDSDIIIIFGGTNDCLYMDKWMFGHVEYDQRMNKGTFCGDLDEMVSGCKWKFHDEIDDHYVKMIYVNPMCTILNDAVYAMDPGNMVEQHTFAAAINEIVPPYEFDVIDLYNQNFLNSHDPQVNSEFITDGVHPNPEGYRILAEHLASEIIQRINQ